MTTKTDLHAALAELPEVQRRAFKVALCQFRDLHALDDPKLARCYALLAATVAEAEDWHRATLADLDFDHVPVAEILPDDLA